MSLLAQLDRRIRYYGGLIVSCQPVPGSPLDNPAIVAAMALAAEQAGAVALRIEGLANLQAVRPLVTVPVIALIKRDLHDSPVRITPWLEDVNALAQAGPISLRLTARGASVRPLSHRCWRQFTARGKT
ncbi:N-acetylmannosamine-6-phosphate 2-epimerase [Klebsiella variicola]|nr:N-acetylmannosamine-6-phosphate 2-epimerase [Klebsiella variicola]